MERRTFLSALIDGLFTMPRAAGAQEPGKGARIAKEVAPGISRVAFLTSHDVATPETLAVHAP